MMKFLSGFFFLLLLVAGGYYFFQEYEPLVEEAAKKAEEVFDSEESTENGENTANNEQTYQAKEEISIIEMNDNLAAYIEKEPEALMEKFGKALRVDPSSYGYENWIYTDESTHYLQVGVSEGKVNMIYAAGKGLSAGSVKTGQTYDQVEDHFDLQKEVAFSYEGNPYRFQLTDEDIKMRPIVQLSENTFMQFYFDSFENRLSSIRILNVETLLAHRPYEIYYRAPLPALPVLDDGQWEEIQKGMEKQVFQLTNVLRFQYGSQSLEWDEAAAAVASGHSKDMYENNYFSHYSLDGRGLKERLREFDVQYFSAGENIAAQYTDSPAAVEGWLNSEGHREALLDNQYTHLGVGVYRYFYTQNFLQKS